MGIGVFFAILDAAGIANRPACAGCGAAGVGAAIAAFGANAVVPLMSFFRNDNQPAAVIFLLVCSCRLRPSL